MKERYDAYEVAVRNNILQVDEIRREEDYEPLGFNFIKLGLQDVLLNPETMEVYTPNTGQSKNLLTGEERAELRGKRQYIQGPDGKMKGSKSVSGGGSAKGVDKSEKDAIIEHKEEIIADFKSTNFNGEIHIPPKSIDTSKLTIDSEHIEKRGHNVSEKQAKQYIKDAVVSYSKTVEGQNYENYIGFEGTAYVNVDMNVIRTAYPKSQFTAGTKRLLKTLNKHTKKE